MTGLTMVLAPAAEAEGPSGRIDLNKGVAGVNLKLKRGPITTGRGRSQHTARTVASLLGKPKSVHNLPREGQTPDQRDAEKTIYLANYTDDGLSVFYRKLDKKGRADTVRDRYDRVVGVVTFTPRYAGPFKPGSVFPTGNDAGCAPLDRRFGPGGGPRRMSACPIDPPGEGAYDIAFLSGTEQSRSTQRVSQLGIYERLLGILLMAESVDGALKDLDCENPQCN